MNPRLCGWHKPLPGNGTMHYAPKTLFVMVRLSGNSTSRYVMVTAYATRASSGSNMPLASWQSDKYPPVRAGLIDIRIKNRFLHHSKNQFNFR